MAKVAGGCAAVAYDATLSAIVRLSETNLTAAAFAAQQRAQFVVAVATTLGVGEARVVVTNVQAASASTYQTSRHRHRRRLLQAPAQAQGVDVSFEVAELPTAANSTAARLTDSLTNGALGAALVVAGLAPVVTIESVPMAPTITLPSPPPPTPPPSSPPPAAAAPTTLSSGSKSDGFSTNFTSGNVRLSRVCAPIIAYYPPVCIRVVQSLMLSCSRTQTGMTLPPVAAFTDSRRVCRGEMGRSQFMLQALAIAGGVAVLLLLCLCCCVRRDQVKKTSGAKIGQSRESVGGEVHFDNVRSAPPGSPEQPRVRIQVRAV